MASSLLNKKSLCIVTGASRGYGKCLAEKFASKVGAGSTFLLIARNTKNLQEVTENVKNLNPLVSVFWHEFDQSKVNECSNEAVRGMLSDNKIVPDNYEQLLLFHNAGTTGDLTKFAYQMNEPKMVEETMNCNVTGTILLNSSLLSIFTKESMNSRVIINVSSLAALQPFPSWSLYCAGKAARDMFFSTLAKEDSSLHILNYAPGPLDTEMQKTCRECADENIRKIFIDMHKDGKLLSCEASVDKLIELLDKNTFTSGAHVDYYDV